MLTESTEYFDEHADTYDAWYDRHPREYEDQVRFIAALLPSGNGLEIGVGTGRFAARLGIGTGIDLSERMLELSRKRGVEAILADAAKLPFRDLQFDYSLNMVTICFLENPLASIREARRVSRIVVTVILDRDSEYVQNLMKRREGFYRYAKFYTASEVVGLYIEAGFTEIEIREELLTTEAGEEYRLVGIIGR